MKMSGVHPCFAAAIFFTAIAATAAEPAAGSAVLPSRIDCQALAARSGASPAAIGRCNTDLAASLRSNPRMGRLIQLAAAKNCQMP